ncbi:MAG: Triosephosphate isomerase [Candidatus Jorgensenbacteria bacterium GW2011_GWA1_48_13]|uniref:Triosephosphate isomerase n=2 Tax=Candidatus Joergenseniibacteriota TaxID=1752739 RepID=A0A0G1YIP4_9BACT|nr:MAG: Triosephosphate isomerase [Candidatus Jorgensenbacteria bacterium GW2011_GWA1_48_13]KKU98442.1 MAG: Triosephosphate isomerase [Candidatus Jorgensenbacteria bacterium GW2011_GWC1_48_8]KKW14867.1 MAG: Triosephosphate isomerase [Candidatus Jorgensenbacteria bacterium GW2011_GWB1_50_10]
MSKLIIANWKMNPSTVSQAVKLARAEDKKGVVIAPPFPFLPLVSKVLRKAKLGAQDAFWVPKGAYTGEVSIHQLKTLRVKYVIIGHSERRGLGETDWLINKKIRAALAEDLTVILCVGEPWRVRRKGLAAAKRFVKQQLQKDLKGTDKLTKLKAESLITAYEPVWAIGTGHADRPEGAVEMIKFIKKNLQSKTYNLKSRVLYGGSVTGRNAAGFLKQKEIGGALVGGASLKPSEFKRIIRSL